MAETLYSIPEKAIALPTLPTPTTTPPISITPPAPAQYPNLEKFPTITPSTPIPPPTVAPSIPTQVVSGYSYGNWRGNAEGTSWENVRTGERVSGDPYGFKSNPQTETITTTVQKPPSAAPQSLTPESGGYSYGNWRGNITGDYWENIKTGERVSGDPYHFRENPRTEVIGEAVDVPRVSYTGSLTTGQAQDMPTGTPVAFGKGGTIEQKYVDTVVVPSLGLAPAPELPPKKLTFGTDVSQTGGYEKGYAPTPEILKLAVPPTSSQPAPYTPSAEFSEKLATFLAGGTKEAPIQFGSEAAKLRAIEIASKSSQGSPNFYSYKTPEEKAREQALANFMAYTGLSYKPGEFTPTPAVVSTPMIAGMISGLSADAMNRNLTLSPDVLSGMAKARQDIQDRKTASEFAKYSASEKAGVVLGMDPGAIIDLYASRSTFFGKPLAGQDIVTIPKGWVGGETDWKWRIPTQKEAETSYTKSKVETIQELKNIQASKDLGEKIYGSVKYGATWLPSEAVVTYGAGALLGTAIPLTGALSRIGLSKVASKLATTEASGIGAKTTEFAVKKIATPLAENAESLMNVAGAGMILGQVKKAGQTDQGLTLGTSVVEGAKLAVAYKGFQKTYEPTMKALKGVESLPKEVKTISAVEKEMAGLKSEKGTFGWTGEAPRSPTSNAPSGQRLLELDKEIAGQSRWTGGVGGKSGEAPSNYPKTPGRFGFSDLMGKLPESFGKYSESGSVKPLRTSEYGYGQEVIPNPFEGFGGVSKTVVGIGKGLAERGELPVPDFGSGLLKSYMGTELQIKDMNVFRPEVNPKIDMFGNLRGEGKNEVIISHPVWTGSELGYDVFNQQKYGYREPIKNREGYSTPVEFPGYNPIEFPNPVKNPVVNPNPTVNENPNQFIYENKYEKGTPPPYKTPGAGIFLPPKLGAGGFSGFGSERIGKSVIEHKLTDPTDLFTGGRTFASSTSVPYQSNMMTLNIKAKQATQTNAGKIAKSMFELNIQQEKSPIVPKTSAPKVPKAQTTTRDFLSLNIPTKKGAKRRKNK